MNIESIRDYCLSLPATGEDMAFGDDYLLLRVCGRIFACLNLARPDYLVLKADADYAVDLRDRYAEIEPAWHWNKKYWIQLRLSGSLADDFMRSLIRHSYAQVVKKLPRRVRMEYPAITEI